LIRHRLRVAGALSATLLVASCANTVTGTPMSVFGDPFSVAGLPAADGPTGLRDDAEPPNRDVTGTDGGETDKLAASSVVDIEQFWESIWGKNFDGTFKPVKELVSWDSGGFDSQFCGNDTYGVVNAAFCVPQNRIGWDRGELLPELRKADGDIAVTMVLAHEYGHSVQKQAKMVVSGTQTLVSEQQADCLSGVYMRWVAEGNSPRFTLSTGDGLNSVLAAMISFRDPLFNESDSEAVGNEHGSAFERISAFQFGFTDGPSSCAAINMTEINGRRGDLPVLLPDGEEGELPVTERSVQSIVDAMGILFSPKDPPKLTFDRQDCTDARVSAPATYCPSSNTIIVDLPALASIGSASESRKRTGLVIGDNTAYSILVSRYMQAIQHERGVSLDTARAALRTACLTGVATVKMSKPVTPSGGDTIQLTAGDIDEAVSGILVNGLAASDVNGDTVPAGFSRIDAFRVGVLGDEERCFKRFA
jgi:predicted metalloprotease